MHPFKIIDVILNITLKQQIKLIIQLTKIEIEINIQTKLINNYIIV